MRTDHGALTLAPAAGLEAHQLVDHPEPYLALRQAAFYIDSEGVKS